MKLLNQTPVYLARKFMLMPLIWLLTSLHIAYGQAFINTLPSNETQLNASELLRYTTLQQDAFTHALQLINIGNPNDFIGADGVLRFEFPGIQETIEAEAVEIDPDENGYFWTGKLLSHNGSFGYYETEGRRAAWLQVAERFFEIMPLKPGVSTLRELRQSILDAGICPLSNESESSSAAVELCQTEYNTCPATIDILVLIPPDVTAWLQNRFGDDPFGKKLYLGLGTHALNTAFANSDIPNKRARFMFEDFNFNYPNGTDCANLLSALQNQATARRNTVGADLVLLLTAFQDYSCGAGAACGQLGINHPHCDLGLAFAEIWWIFHPRWTALHEIGHLMGAGHERPDPVNMKCAYGWTVGGNRFQRTLMAYWNGTEEPTDVRILHFSNPDVFYNGDPTGTPNDNNAKAIRNGACLVANYRDKTVFDARIETDPWVCRSWDNISLAANVQLPLPGDPGIPPYSYEWRWNFSGNFISGTSTLIGNTPIAGFAIPATGSHVWVQLKVSSADGVTITRLEKIEIFDDDFPKCIWREKNQPAPATSAIHPFSIMPNPTDSHIQLSWISPAEGPFNLQLRDHTGRIVMFKNLWQSPGDNTHHFNVEDLPGGVYTLFLNSGKAWVAQKLIISH